MTGTGLNAFHGLCHLFLTAALLGRDCHYRIVTVKEAEALRG